MSATVNPLLLTGRNPTGANLGNPLVMSDFAEMGPNALLPNVGTSASKASTPQNNPFATSSTGIVPGAQDVTGAFPANSGPFPTTGGGGIVPTGPTSNVAQAASSPIGGLSSLSPKDLSRLFDSLKKSYGDGMAHLLLNFLTSGAGYNQQAINNLLASLQPGIERGQENIMEQFSALGDRFGSPAAIGEADFLSQVNLNEGQLVTQMYEQAIQNFINVMMGTGSQVAKTKAASPSFLDQLGSILNLGGSAAGGASSIISAINPSADTGVLDAIAGALAGF